MVSNSSEEAEQWFICTRVPLLVMAKREKNYTERFQLLRIVAESWHALQILESWMNDEYGNNNV